MMLAIFQASPCHFSHQIVYSPQIKDLSIEFPQTLSGLYLSERDSQNSRRNMIKHFSYQIFRRHITFSPFDPTDLFPTFYECKLKDKSLKSLYFKLEYERNYAWSKFL